MVKGRGGGKTPNKVVALINQAASEKSLRSVSKSTGLGLAAISRYSQGIGEPTQATLEKLAEYFGVSVSELRGGISTTKPVSAEMEARVQEKIKEFEDGLKKYSKFAQEYLDRLPQDKQWLGEEIVKYLVSKSTFEPLTVESFVRRG